MNINLPNPLLFFIKTFIPYVIIIYFIAYKGNVFPVSFFDWSALFLSYSYSVMAMLCVCHINANTLSNYPKNRNLTPIELIKYDYIGTSGNLLIFIVVLFLTAPVVTICFYMQIFDYIGVGFASLAVSTITGVVSMKMK